MKQKPLLSVGIIFKDEIRCLERCVKSLQKLRDTLPCELVMADTGSSDGSREVARKYADIFFDFPWINDFAAARNAVMDRCSGVWFMTVDADEWLDDDITELTAFLLDSRRWEYPCCGVVVRNYQTPDLDEDYSDFLGARLCLMSTNMRYEGAIHERWDYAGIITGLGQTVLHHDGYAELDTSQRPKKQERNMPLLLEKLKKDPDDIRTQLQCIEAARGDPSYERYVRDGIRAVEERRLYWEQCGPPIFRYAVQLAAIEKLPELESWAARARELFPQSPYVTIDITYLMFLHYAEQVDYARAIPLGEQYLQNLKGFRKREFDPAALMFSTVVMGTPTREGGVRAILADAYFHEEQFQQAKAAILSIDRHQMTPKAAGISIRVLLNLQVQSREDLSQAVAEIWEQASGSDTKSRRLRAVVIKEAAAAFASASWRREDEKGYTHAYMLFRPLAGKCALGTAAVILESGDRTEIEEMLRTVEDWEELPIAALERALLAGVAFPLPDRPLALEEMDGLTVRLAQNRDYLPGFLDKAVHAMDGGPQALAWARGLTLAALRSETWEAGADGLAVIKAFVAVERAFLPWYYAPTMLCEENICLLPPMHRFGWYCARAFDALDANAKADYVRLLREGLGNCAEAKPIVEFLLKQFEESRKVQAVPELLALAEQVRKLLAQYPADDPTVEALKKSAAYQKVAHLIEVEQMDSTEQMMEDIAMPRNQLAARRGRKVLMVAYYFPPLSGSGVFRSLKFAKYLPEFSWQPTVISTDRPPNGWKFEDQSQLEEIPADVEVIRIPDHISTGRETSLSGDRVQNLLSFLRNAVRYSPDADKIFTQMSQSEKGVVELITFPCAALSWAYDVAQYISKNIDLEDFQAVYTTSGPASAHLIGFFLKQKYGISWIADYRDPWTFNAYGADYDPGNAGHKLLFELESVLLHQADCNLTIADEMVRSYQEHFGLPQEQIVSITNGYDEADFAGLPFPVGRTEKFTINYSGVLYTDHRSIEPVLTALRQLGKDRKIDLSQVCFRIVGVGVENYFAVAQKYGLEHVMVQTGYLSHRDALLSNMNADLLLLLVGDEARFQHVFTGKFFDYLRSGKPILALAPKGGAVARVLRETGHGETFLSTQTGQIKAMILREYRKWERSEVPELLHSPVIERFERKVLTKQLADVFESIKGAPPKFLEIPSTLYNDSYLSGGAGSNYHQHYTKSFYYPSWQHAMSYLELVDRDSSILEIACGAGQFANMLFDSGFNNYIGFDYAEEGVALAKKNNPDNAGKFFVADAFETDLLQKRYDLVICFEALEHIQKDIELLQRICPGTRMLLSVPNFDDPYHVRYFKNKDEVRTRYSKVMRIIDISVSMLGDTNCLYYIWGEKL